MNLKMLMIARNKSQNISGEQIPNTAGDRDEDGSVNSKQKTRKLRRRSSMGLILSGDAASSQDLLSKFPTRRGSVSGVKLSPLVVSSGAAVHPSLDVADVE